MATEAPSAEPTQDIAVPPEPAEHASRTEVEALAPGKVQVIRRNGKVTHFDRTRSWSP